MSEPKRIYLTEYVKAIGGPGPVQVAPGFEPVKMSNGIFDYMFGNKDEFRDLFWTAYYDDVPFIRQKPDQLQIRLARSRVKNLENLFQIDPLKLTESQKNEIIQSLNALELTKSILEGADKHPDPDHENQGGRVEPASHSFNTFPLKDNNGNWYITVVETHPENDKEQMLRLLRIMGYKSILVKGFKKHRKTKQTVATRTDIIREKNGKFEVFFDIDVPDNWRITGDRGYPFMSWVDYDPEEDAETHYHEFLIGRIDKRNDKFEMVERFQPPIQCDICQEKATVKCALCFKSSFCSNKCAVGHKC